MGHILLDILDLNRHPMRVFTNEEMINYHNNIITPTSYEKINVNYSI